MTATAPVTLDDLGANHPLAELAVRPFSGASDPRVTVVEVVGGREIDFDWNGKEPVAAESFSRGVELVIVL